MAEDGPQMWQALFTLALSETELVSEESPKQAMSLMFFHVFSSFPPSWEV